MSELLVVCVCDAESEPDLLSLRPLVGVDVGDPVLHATTRRTITMTCGKPMNPIAMISNRFCWTSTIYF